MASENESYEHTIVIDKDITINLNMPKRMSAFEFKGFVKKVDSLVKITGIEIPPGFVPLNRPQPEKHEEVRHKQAFTPEQIAELKAMRDKQASLTEMATFLSQKYGIRMSKSTLGYSVKKDFMLKRYRAHKEIPPQVYEQRRTFLPDFTEEQKEYMLRAYYLDGKGIGEIRELMMANYQRETNYKAVYNVIYKSRKENTPLYIKVMGNKPQTQEQPKDNTKDISGDDDILQFQAPEF